MRVGVPPPALKIMEELPEENRQREEKKALYVGLITILIIIGIFIISISFIRGCSQENGEKIKEAEKQPAATPEQAVQSPTPPAQEGSVAGESSETVAPDGTKGTTYTVQSGETLYEIGKKFKIDWHIIAEVNEIDDSTALRAGKKIIIPTE